MHKIKRLGCYQHPVSVLKLPTKGLARCDFLVDLSLQVLRLKGGLFFIYICQQSNYK